MADIDTDLLLRAIHDWEQAPHGSKGAVLAERLPLLGMTAATFHRQRARMGFRTERKPRSDRGRVREADRAAWVEQVMALKYSTIKGVRSLATEDAVRLAVQWGRVPAAAAAMPLGTINRIAREHGLLPTPRRESRFEAPWANYMHQVDASGSEHFFPKRAAGTDWVLGVRPGQLKNKEKLENLRVWCWGLADDFSGARMARYVVSPGESALDGIKFLQWCWEKNPEHHPLEGIPDNLYMDNGALAKTKAFRRFVGEIGVNVITHEPYRPMATGKVESGWKDQWKRFEALFLRGPARRRKEWEISLTELNQELARFRRESNRRAHRRLSASKEGAWLASVRDRGGVVSIAPGAWGTIFRDTSRTLDAAGCFDLDGRVWQVKDIWSRRVLVYVGFLDGQVIVEDPRDGRKYPAVEFAPKVAGEYRGAPKSELEELLERTVAEHPEPRRVTWREDEAADNVVHLVRSKEERDNEAWPEEDRGKAKGERRKGEEEDKLTELAAGACIIERGVAPEAEIYANELDRFTALRVKELRGLRLEAEEVEFMAAIREGHKAYRMLRDDIERRARLAVVE